jgi:hypothetical protein
MPNFHASTTGHHLQGMEGQRFRYYSTTVYGTLWYYDLQGADHIEWYFISQGTKPRDSPSKSGSTKMIRCSNKSTV